ncbi:glycine cleavage system protein GcvH [Nakamurella leprariae]|uniref:Glycine cleavage system H protein n=1 Tax=Nakamurella leprariae TaxID=2803911 RepID=A0A939C0G0_9ACTN|nr:glycine cleavage system protein GcvH [Nakamurella leprariae]MBM9469195.1 glycine cleavage system protein GcvH [Nakamurella leprariae]
MIPEELRYSRDHEWVRTGQEGPGTGEVYRVGITDHAQSELGDIVFVQLAEPGTTVSAGESIGEVESTKSVSDLFAPVGGTVVARNAALEDNPELVNSDPYGAGWLLDLQPDDPAQLDDLLDAAGYAEVTAGN